MLDHKIQGFKERGNLDESPECHIGVLLHFTWSIISCRGCLLLGYIYMFKLMFQQHIYSKS